MDDPRRSRREFEEVNRDHMTAYKKAITAYGWFYPVVEFISMVALACILTLGGVRVGSGTLTLGVVVAFGHDDHVHQFFALFFFEQATASGRSASATRRRVTFRIRDMVSQRSMISMTKVTLGGKKPSRGEPGVRQPGTYL